MKRYYIVLLLLHAALASLAGHLPLPSDNIFGNFDYSTGFSYDANGNLYRDLSRDILETRYNRLNKPKDVYFLHGHRQTVTYDGFGQKRQVLYRQTSDPILATMMGVPEDSAYTLLGRRDYIGPHVFANDSLEYSAFPGGYFTPAGTFYYITDWQGNNIAVLRADGSIEQQTTYYPYGEPTIEPTGQRWLFGGKEREHAGGRNTYDYGARILTPLNSWTTPDPLATDFLPFSPFSLCGGDPINYVDPDGRIAYPIIMMLFGAGSDIIIQTSFNMAKGYSLWQAVCNIDATSVLYSAASCALFGPINSNAIKYSAIVICSAVDASVDINLNGSIKYLGGYNQHNKNFTEFSLDFLSNVLSDVIDLSLIFSVNIGNTAPETLEKILIEQGLNNLPQEMLSVILEEIKILFFNNPNSNTIDNNSVKNNIHNNFYKRLQYVEPTDAIQARFYPTPNPSPVNINN